MPMLAIGFLALIKYTWFDAVFGYSRCFCHSAQLKSYSSPVLKWKIKTQFTGTPSSNYTAFQHTVIVFLCC